MKMKKVVRMPLRRTPSNRPPVSTLRARAATAEEDYDEEDYGGEDEPNMKLSHAVIVVLALHLIAVGGIFAFNSIKANQTASDKKAAVTKVDKTKTVTTSVAESTAATTAAATTTSAAATSASSEGANTHTVQAGETLTKIAMTHGVSVDALQQANELTSVSILRVGQVLKLPTASTSIPAAKTTTQPAKPIAATPTTTMAAAPVTTAPKTEAKPAPAKTATSAPEASADVYVVEKGDNPYSIAKKLKISYNELLSVNGIKDPTKIQIGQKLKIPTKTN